MVERIAFKGRTAEGVGSMQPEEFIKSIKSRERRWIQRNSLQLRSLMDKIKEYRETDMKKPLKTHTREAVILPAFVGLDFAIYNGKEFTPVHVTANMVGRRLGEFSYTTKRVQHSNPGIRATRGSKFIAVK